MSASSKPTLAPVFDNANAKFNETVDFPTPPLPLATAITFFTVDIASSAAKSRPSITFAVTFMS